MLTIRVESRRTQCTTGPNRSSQWGDMFSLLIESFLFYSIESFDNEMSVVEMATLPRRGGGGAGKVAKYTKNMNTHP